MAYTSYLLLTGSLISAGLILTLITLPSALENPADAERDWSKCIFGEKLKPNCSDQQGRAFNKCIERAGEDGELTEDEYFACAYSIYG